MMEQRLTMISLGVADLARSRAFYLDGLGWQEREESSEHIVFIPMIAWACTPIANWQPTPGLKRTGQCSGALLWPTM